MLDSILVWFRRDLRDIDHAALGEALRRARRVHCAFVFDREILDALETRADRRVEFIRDALLELDAALRRRGGGLLVQHGWATREIPRLARELGVAAVFTNRDYEPQAKRRDAVVAAALSVLGISFEAFKDQALLDGEPSAYRDMVLMNAAAALVVADKASDVREGVEIAAAAIDEGKANAALTRLVAVSNQGKA